VKGTRQGKTGPRSPENTLSRCFVEGGACSEAQDRTRRRKALGASLTIETALLASLVVSPLLTSVAQPQLRVSPPMQIVLGSWRAHETGLHAVPKPIHPTQTTAVLIPQTFFSRPLVKTHDDPERYDPSVPVFPGDDISGAIQLTGPLGTLPRVEPPQIERQSPQEKQTVKISEGVQQAQLVSRIEPRYPILAIQTRTQGSVRLRAIISRDGRITSLKVISGHPLLVQAALDAVGQWRYRPTLLSGEPAEVETFITVFFRLGQ
jgi:periplasmic protein TonB